MFGELLLELLTQEGILERPHIVVGASLSSVSLATAPVTGAVGTPQISYASTSPKLTSQDAPMFFRTIPADTSTSPAVCQFWRHDMDYRIAAIIYSADAYGEAYNLQLTVHCARLGVTVRGFPYTPGDHQSIREQVGSLARTHVRVVLAISPAAADTITLFETAHADGILGLGTMWLVTDSPSSSDLVGLSDKVLAGVHGSIRIRAAARSMAKGTPPRVFTISTTSWKFSCTTLIAAPGFAASDL